ncbi:MAG: urease accessory protein UreE [Betaproteobacteria bacterium]|nr:urease accessory protein UreE [Betaproteobacteria bacterium]
MLIFRKLGGVTEQLVGEIDLAFEWRQKSRMRTVIRSGARAGESVGFDLPRGTVLREGDLIATDSGEVLRVHAAPEELIHVTAQNATALSRIAYHLGNRHVPVQVGDGWLRLQYDHVLEGMVRGLGGSIALVDDSFDPEGGAYAGGVHAHSHSHSHGSDHDHDHDHAHGHSHHHAPEPARAPGQHADARHSPRIHDFLTDPLKR